MRIMFLAPQPFFQERGTPISIDLMLRSLSERGDKVDVLTYHLGETRKYVGVNIARIHPPLPPRSIDPGFSWKKVYCDLFLLVRAVRAIRARPYDLIHAVEEGAFMAMLLSALFRVPYVYDMDSSIAAQILQRYRWLRPAGPVLRGVETLAMRRALAVVPMCEALATVARRHCRGSVHVLKDISLIPDAPGPGAEDVRLMVGAAGPVLMYAGNLEPYQGIELLLESFRRLSKHHPEAVLVIIGGKAFDIDEYRQRARELKIADRVHFLGPRPVAALGDYLRQADLLISPRTQGDNTPLKLYSYLDSGVAVVATDLPTHTQVVTAREAALAPPEPRAFAAAINRLLDDPAERAWLGRNARLLIQRQHTPEAFRVDVDRVFSELESRLAGDDKVLVRLR